jgi:hypothetical protein
MSAYQRRIWQALAVQAAGAVAGGAAVVLLIGHASELPLPVVLAGLVLAGVVLVAAGQPWWRRIDEMEREEHSLAWYEGGVPGAALALLCLLGVAAHSGAHLELALGGAICFGAQAAFYLVFWAIRRSVRSPRAAAR